MRHDGIVQSADEAAGGANLQAKGKARHSYVSALRSADDHDIMPPVIFARS